MKGIIPSVKFSGNSASSPRTDEETTVPCAGVGGIARRDGRDKYALGTRAAGVARKLCREAASRVGRDSERLTATGASLAAQRRRAE
jgi:hypothetical protein